MKKIMVLAAAVAVGVSLADTQTVNGVVWHYTVEGRGAILNSGAWDVWRDDEDGVCVDTSTSGDLEIPSRLGGKLVTAVGDCAFRDCSKITSVKFPASVEYIGNEAFFGCTSLTNINLSEGLESFGDRAFFGCPKLETIAFPDSLKHVESYAFGDCFALREVRFGKGLLDVGQAAFGGCSNLLHVYLGGDAPIARGTRIYVRTPTNLLNHVKSAARGWGATWPANDEFSRPVRKEP